MPFQPFLHHNSSSNSFHKNVFYVSNITSSGKEDDVRDSERNIQNSRKRLCKKRFTASCWPDKQIFFLKLNIFRPLVLRINTFVMVINRHRKRFFRLSCPMTYSSKILRISLGFGISFNSVSSSDLILLLQSLCTAHTFITYINPWTCNELSNLILSFSTKRTF